METERDTTLALIASTFVLFSAMLDARLTMVLSVIIFVGLIISQTRNRRLS